MSDLRRSDIVRIGVLVCDHVREELKPVAGDYSDMFHRLLTETECPVELVYYEVINFKYPEAIQDCDGYLITGSAASVYDNEEWISALQEFVVRLYENKVRTVGICFGHQMIAKALGGQISKDEKGWGIGLKKLCLPEKYWWMNPFQESISMFVSHQDQVQVLPHCATLISGYEHCPRAMYHIEEFMFCMQAHPEFPGAYAQALAKTRVHKIPRSVMNAAMQTFSLPADSASVAMWIVNFIKQKEN